MKRASLSVATVTSAERLMFFTRGKKKLLSRNHLQVIWHNGILGTGLRILNHAPFKDEEQTALFKDPVRTALSTLFISVIKISPFMM